MRVVLWGWGVYIPMVKYMKWTHECVPVKHTLDLYFTYTFVIENLWGGEGLLTQRVEH